MLQQGFRFGHLALETNLKLSKWLAIITYPYPDELLNRGSELVTKCGHENKFLLKNFSSNDLSPYYRTLMVTI